MIQKRPDKCSHCSKPTVLHVTKVIDGKAYKMGYCSACPEAESLKHQIGFDLIASSGGAASATVLHANAHAACPGCGLTPADFKEHGRLGCHRCYDTFSDRLDGLFRKLHRGTSHAGKAPGRRVAEVTPERIELLKQRLEEHVRREEFEQAASLRDQLKSLERQLLQ